MQQRQTAKIALVLGLAAVLAVVLLWRFHVLPVGSGRGGKVAAAAGPNPAGSAAGAPETPAQVRLAWQRPEPIGPIHRDPTRTDVAQDSSAASKCSETPAPPQVQLPVEGIIFNTTRPSALIVDGVILHEGDALGDATVLRIAGSRRAAVRGPEANCQTRRDLRGPGADPPR